jgi:hypothetical protein
MSAIAPWAIGKNFAMTAYPLTITTDGTISAGSAISFVGILNDSGNGSKTTYQTENISPLDSPYSNMVDIEQQTTYTLSEVMQAANPLSSTSTATGLVPNALNYLANNSRFVKLVVNYKNNSGSNVYTETAYLKWDDYQASYVKRKNVGQMTLNTVAVANGTAGAYVANPTIG